MPRLPVYLAKGQKPPTGAKFEMLGEYNIATGRIFPGNHTNETVGRIEKVDGILRQKVLSVSEANDLVRKNSYFIMYGRVLYSDEFGVPHWSIFCTSFFIDGSNVNLPKCANHADDDSN